MNEEEIHPTTKTIGFLPSAYNFNARDRWFALSALPQSVLQQKKQKKQRAIEQSITNLAKLVATAGITNPGLTPSIPKDKADPADKADILRAKELANARAAYEEAASNIRRRQSTWLFY